MCLLTFTNYVLTLRILSGIPNKIKKSTTVVYEIFIMLSVVCFAHGDEFAFVCIYNLYIIANFILLSCLCIAYKKRISIEYITLNMASIIILEHKNILY